MNRYAQGEQSAFAILYQGLEQKLRAFLTRLTGAPVVADDLLQETFMRIHRARGSFDSNAAVVPWAYAIARNAWLDHVRASKVRGERCARKPTMNMRAARGRATGPDRIPSSSQSPDRRRRSWSRAEVASRRAARGVRPSAL